MNTFKKIYYVVYKNISTGKLGPSSGRCHGRHGGLFESVIEDYQLKMEVSWRNSINFFPKKPSKNIWKIYFSKGVNIK